MGIEELIKSIGGAGALVVIAAVYIYKGVVSDPRENREQNKLIERVSAVIANNTEVIRETKVMHKDMEKTLGEIRDDIKELKTSTDLTSVYTMLEKLEDKINQLGK